jgi:hypothetical protein
MKQNTMRALVALFACTALVLLGGTLKSYLLQRQQLEFEQFKFGCGTG